MCHLAAAKATARRAGGHLNDAFVAATTLGLLRYHEVHGAATGSLRMTMPINLRGDESELGGNRFVPARFEVPLVIDDPLDRLRIMHDLVARQRAEPSLSLVDPVAGVLNRLPHSVATGVFGSMLKGIDFVTSNVPGAPIELFSAGAKVTGMHAFAAVERSGGERDAVELRGHLPRRGQQRPRRGGRSRPARGLSPQRLG